MQVITISTTATLLIICLIHRTPIVLVAIIPAAVILLLPIRLSGVTSGMTLTVSLERQVTLRTLPIAPFRMALMALATSR